MAQTRQPTRTDTFGLHTWTGSGRARLLGQMAHNHAVTTDAPLVIGTDPDCGLILRDAYASRRHCEVRAGAHGFWVVDLGSKNGTFYNGARIGEIALPPGAIIRIGDTHIVLEIDSAKPGMDLSPRSAFGDLVGRSLAMRRLFTLLERASQSDATVLLCGETGSGKDLAARAIHDASARKNGPFVVLDCGSSADELIRSELFGHLKGAFTGAMDDRVGAFRSADRGTLLLDEIAELPLELQSALLRATDKQEVVPVGGQHPISVDVRLIAATNRDLPDEVRAGRFRHDLYYRLQVLPIAVPPLRDRYDDLPLLCTRLLRDMGLSRVKLDGEAIGCLAQYSWPGNVRELRNVLQRSLIHAGAGEASTVRPVLPHRPDASIAFEPAGFQQQKRAVIETFERDFLTRLLDEHGGNIRAASRASGIERTQLKRLMRKYDLI